MPGIPPSRPQAGQPADDLDAFLAATHDDWRRWARTSGRLMVKDDYLGFRDGIKAEEQVLDLRLEPEAVEVYGRGP